MRLIPTSRLTRQDGLDALASALPRLGWDYAANRNHAPAAGHPPTSSLLSPYLRHRLITEQEVVQAVLAAQGAAAADKFLQEVFWRTYFKGHLEQHPEIWSGYLDGLAQSRARLAGVPGLARAYAQALGGTTGILCFDAWVRELMRTGWLHNHVRMWFASIWIFSLGLPWELGADVFLRHLLDGDPASNTLGWRWVAGLHTRGKPYVARAENIARFTGGRFDPRGQLDETPEAVSEAEPPARVALPASDVWPGVACALLLHEEDLAPESLVPRDVTVARIGLLPSQMEAAAPVRDARAAAIADAAARAEAAFEVPVTILASADAVQGWAEGSPIVTPYAPVGPTASALSGLTMHRVQRPWDQSNWPHCARGFFQLRARIGAG